MKNIKLMHAKLHRVRVTEANRDYVGSITIDENLLQKVGILPLQEVEIVNVSNGNRWSTYALPGVAGKRDVCPNGGGALLCKPGDILIVFSYQTKDYDQVLKEGHLAKVLVADENNACKQFFQQKIFKEENKISFFQEDLPH
jgi:aspartate 1-decarboxylase